MKKYIRTWQMEPLSAATVATARPFLDVPEGTGPASWPWRALRVWAHKEIGGGESLLVKDLKVPDGVAVLEAPDDTVTLSRGYDGADFPEIKKPFSSDVCFCNS